MYLWLDSTISIPFPLLGDRPSLVNVQKDNVTKKKIIIHQLVQSVIKIELSPEVISRLRDGGPLDRVCNTAFPLETYVDNEVRLLCRKYQDQLLTPLLAINSKASHYRLGKVLQPVSEKMENIKNRTTLLQ